MHPHWIRLAAVFVMLASAPAEGQESGVKVQFRSVPDGATVVVDGKDRCTAPCAMTLHVGKHVVGMSHDGFLAREEMLDIAAGTGTIRWSLERHLGSLEIVSDPEGLTVEVRPKRGKPRRVKTPANDLQLPPGEYTIVLKEADYAPQQRTAVVEAGKRAQVVLEPVPTTGMLSIAVLDEAGDRDEARITLNGKRYRGSGPWSLKPGTYQVKVVYRKRVVLEQPIEVTAGSDVALDVETSPDFR